MQHHIHCNNNIHQEIRGNMILMALFCLIQRRCRRSQAHPKNQPSLCAGETESELICNFHEAGGGVFNSTLMVYFAKSLFTNVIMTAVMTSLLRDTYCYYLLWPDMA